MASSGLRQRGPGDPVLERLDDLRRDSIRAERVYTYVDTGHDAPVKTLDFLHVLRADPALAIELRANTGRQVIAAAERDDGEYRYAVHHYSAVAAKAGSDDPTDRDWARRSTVKQTLEGRDPRVRLREDTDLADLPEGPP